MKTNSCNMAALKCSHIRAGAPPVINPLETQFSENAAFSLAHNFTLMLGSAGPNMTFFNLSNPAVGDWFVAAHLPKDDGKIEPKHNTAGFMEELCPVHKSNTTEHSLVSAQIWLWNPQISKPSGTSLLPCSGSQTGVNVATVFVLSSLAAILMFCRIK
ncbi:Transmembrane protein 8A [Acipenser ruthenus]|uniref:Transmembrane protein 8A n=1 Tax=Acipenser ruthenus TaxID=7906 RepID=A0A444UBD5_ACIRT|nr:Transmembrane protein 8A [Acipenser ruthenus]